MCQSIGYSDEIRFAKNIITYRAKKKGEHPIQYKLAELENE